MRSKNIRFQSIKPKELGFYQQKILFIHHEEDFLENLGYRLKHIPTKANVIQSANLRITKTGTIIFIEKISSPYFQ